MHEQKTVAETVAGNVHAYRQIRGMGQDALAQRMRSLGFPTWRRPTVSEVERGRGEHDGRSVSLAEALGLATALDVTIEQLTDPRGPEGEASLRGPSLILTDKIDNPDLPPGSVTALVCRHKAYAETMWNGDEFQGIVVQLVEEPVR
jgi:transcriptional regulator with XRE-family HTH domain